MYSTVACTISIKASSITLKNLKSMFCSLSLGSMRAKKSIKITGKVVLLRTYVFGTGLISWK